MSELRLTTRQYEKLTVVVNIFGENVMDTTSVRQHKLERCLRIFLPSEFKVMPTTSLACARRCLFFSMK
jgi:hypothetical protein